MAMKKRHEHDSGSPDAKQRDAIAKATKPDAKRQQEYIEEQDRYRRGTHPAENPLWDDTRG